MEEIKTPKKWNFFADYEVIKTWEEKKICPKHGEYISIFEELKNGEKSGSSCPFCKEIQENKELEEFLEQSRKADRINKGKEAHIRPEFYEKELSDFIPKTTGQEKALESVKEMIEKKSGKIILLGSNGAGKTMLGSILARELGGKIYTMYEIATMIRQSYTPKAEKSELEIVEELASIPFLCVDEVGRLKNSEAVQDWFSFILDKRHSSNLPFMLIGNLHFKKDCKEGGCPKCFENYFDNDILSRLRENTKVIQIKSKDERLEKNTLYYYSD